MDLYKISITTTNTYLLKYILIVIIVKVVIYL